MRGPNPNQQAAINATKGPLLIIAGPGSGNAAALYREMLIVQASLDFAGIQFETLRLLEDKAKTYKSEAMAAVYEMMEGLHEVAPSISAPCTSSMLHASRLRRFCRLLRLRPSAKPSTSRSRCSPVI